MARITWQNVDAPDLTSALEAQTIGAGAFSDAASGIADLFSTLGARQKSDANARALEAMRGIDTPEAWDKLMKEQGIAGLGIDPTMASDGLLSAVAGRRGTLEALRSDRRSEEDRARGIEAQRIADEIIGQSGSLEGAQQAILGRRLDPRLEEEALAAAAAANAANWQLNPGTKFDDDVTQTQLNESRSAIEKQRRDMAFEFEKNPLDKLWVEAPSRYGEFGSVLEGMTERLAATVGDEDQERFGKSKGEVTRAFNKMKAQYPEVPEAIVAALMEDSLKQTGYLPRFFDNAQTFKWDDVHKKLEQFSDPVMRGDMELRVQGYQGQQQALQKAASDLDRLENETLLMIQRGAPAEAIARNKQLIAEIRAGFGLQKQATSTKDPAAELLAAAFTMGRPMADFQATQERGNAKRTATADKGPSPEEIAQAEAARLLAEAAQPRELTIEELDEALSRGLSPSQLTPEQRAFEAFLGINVR